MDVIITIIILCNFVHQIALRLRLVENMKINDKGKEIRGLPLITSAPRGGVVRGSKNRPILRTNSLTEVRTRGGSKNPKICKRT